MAWARDWPKESCDDLMLEDMNELNSELNLRANLSNAVFVEGDGLRYAIRTMRVRVDTAMTNKFLNEDGYLYAPIGTATSGVGYAKIVNIFEEIYGAPRLAWQNEADGTEATAVGGWWPPACSLEDSEPYIFHVNELYDVIDALEWLIVSPSSSVGIYRNGVCFSGGGGGAATKQDALDTAWTAYLADTSNAGYGQVDISRMGFPFQYQAVVERSQFFSIITLLAATTAVRYVIYHIVHNNFAEDPAGAVAAPPEDSLSFYAGTAVPDYYGATGWTYGSLSGTLPIPDVLVNVPTGGGAELDGAWIGELTNNLTPGSVNYFRSCLTTIDTKPQYLVDSGYWTGGLAHRLLRMHTSNRWAVKLF